MDIWEIVDCWRTLPRILCTKYCRKEKIRYDLKPLCISIKKKFEKGLKGITNSDFAEIFPAQRATQ